MHDITRKRICALLEKKKKKTQKRKPKFSPLTLTVTRCGRFQWFGVRWGNVKISFFAPIIYFAGAVFRRTVTHRDCTGKTGRLAVSYTIVTTVNRNNRVKL